MLFFLATSQYSNIQSNTTKVKVHLRNGIAEIFDQHLDLMGLVENNLIEIETNFENKLEKMLFVLQDAVFIVSSKGLDPDGINIGTSVYVYARNVKEITPTTSLEEISKEYEVKNASFEAQNEKLAEKQKLAENQNSTQNEKLDGAELSKIPRNSQMFLLKGEVDFLKKVVAIVKDLKS